MRLGKINRRIEFFLQGAKRRKLRSVIRADDLDGETLENLTDHVFCQQSATLCWSRERIKTKHLLVYDESA